MQKNKGKKIIVIKNLLYSVSANIISMLVSAVLLILLPNLLGETEYGYWQLYLFYTSYVYIGLFLLSIVLFIFLTHKEDVILIARYIWIAISGPVLVYMMFFNWLYSRSLKIDR